MSKTFTYKEENEQGWLVEKPDESKKPGCYVGDETGLLCEACNEYRKYKSTLRRFKYDYQDPGKEMELGKDFEVKRRMLSYKETVSDGILTSSKTEIIYVAIPITQRTYSEQDLLEAWELGGSSAYNCVNPSVSCDFDSDKHKKDKQQYFKRFGIEIK